MPVITVGEEAIARWEELLRYVDDTGMDVPYREIRKYDVRRGPQWATAMRVGSSICEPWLRTRNWYPTDAEPWWVRLRSAAGGLALVPSMSTPDLAAPPDWEEPVESDEHLGGFAGGKNGCEVDEDGDLVFAAGEVTADYTSLEIDLGAPGRHILTARVSVEAEDFRTPIAARIADWNVPLEDLIGEPCGCPISDPRWSERDLRGIDIYEPQVRWRLYVTTYDLAGSPGAFVEFVPGGMYDGHYATFNLALERDVGNDLAIDDVTNAEPIVVTTNPAHGLHTGQRVRIFGVAGTTAANGTWRITVLTDDSFELDGSTGNGAYTSGGTVVVDVWAHVSGLACYGATPPTGGGFTSSFPWINVKSAIYGAQGTGGDDTAAINAAIAAAKAANGGMGAVVYFPAGTYGVTSQILVPSRVWLVGEHSISTQIQALAGFPSATAVVRLGEGTGSVFNCRLWRLRVDANHVVGSSCVYSNEANEWSGLFDVELTNYDQYGAAFASGCSVIGVERVGGYGTNTGNSLAHLVFASVAGQSFIRDVSCAGGAGYVVADALLVTSSQVHVDGFHCERATDGIHFGSGATGIIENIYGHNSVANLIHAEGFQVTLESILPNGATNILVDDYRSYTHTTAALGHINFMSLYHWNLGLVDVRSGTQTDYRKLTIPNLGGADRTMGVEGVSALDSFAMSGAAYRLLQINATGDAARVVGIGGFTLPDEDNTHAYSILPGQLTADVTIKCPDTTHLSTYTHRLVTNNSIEELRYKTLVDSVVMRNGQTGAKAWLSSDDQTAAAEIRVPDLGGVGPFYPAVRNFAQTFSAKQTFAAGLDVKTAAFRISDDDATEQWLSLDVAVQSADRVLTIPALAANDTIAVLGLSQTFSALKTFSAGLTVSAGVVTLSACGGFLLPATLPASDGALAIDPGDGSLKMYWNGGEYTIYTP